MWHLALCGLKSRVSRLAGGKTVDDLRRAVGRPRQTPGLSVAVTRIEAR